LPLQGPGSSLKFLKHRDVLPPTGASRTEESRQASKSETENKVKRRNIVDGTSCLATQALPLGAMSIAGGELVMARSDTQDFRAFQNRHCP
jgi:hypothetical protein